MKLDPTSWFLIVVCILFIPLTIYSLIDGIKSYIYVRNYWKKKDKEEIDKKEKE